MSTAVVNPPPSRVDIVAERFGYELAMRPWLRRTLAFWLFTHVLSLWALIAAPPAAAATMAAALNWTGITDSYGVPVGAYFLSTVDTMEAVTEAAPDISVVDPGSWVRWGAHAITTGVTHESVASWVQAQASVYIFMVAAVLWLLKFAMSSTWLYWLAAWFAPILEALRRLLTELHFFELCLLAGVAVGAFFILWHGHRGRGTAIILSAFAIGMIGLWLTRDPLGELTGNDGLLNQARMLAFGVAQAAVNNGPITTGSSTAQLGHLTTILADALLRAPLQIWNFGTTVDSIGTCGNQWSAAIISGVRDAPAHAMRNCGAPEALQYAQQIDGGMFALGIGFIFLGLLLTIFVSYITYSYIMVCGAALLNAIMAIFAAGPAMISGTPRRRARRRLEQFFRHAFLVFVYVLYACLSALLILKAVEPGGFADQVGMTSPVATLVIVGLFSVVATGLLHYLKRELLHDSTRQDLNHAVQSAIHGGKSGYRHGQDTYTKGRGQLEQARKTLSRKPASDSDDGHSANDDTLTLNPVSGRPAGGRPTRQPTTPRPPRPSPQNAAASASARTATGAAARRGGAMAGSASPAAGAGAAGGAVEAAATVAAPEVVIPAAAAGAAARRINGHPWRSPQHPGHTPALGGSGAQRLSTSAQPRNQTSNGSAARPQPNGAAEQPPQRAQERPAAGDTPLPAPGRRRP